MAGRRRVEGAPDRVTERAGASASVLWDEIVGWMDGWWGELFCVD